MLTQTVDLYDGVGNILKTTTTDPLATDAAHYSYDGLNQLTTEPNHNYSYDSLHNRLSKDGEAYSVNSLHSLLSAGTTNYSYDRAGNRLKKHNDQEEVSYFYDDLDRLTAITANGITTTYSYDAFHRRISSTSDDILTNYIYLLENEVGSCDASGNIGQLRILGEGLGAEIGASIAIELSGATYVPIHDFRGNISLLTDLSGNLIEWYRYTAFGEEELFSAENDVISTALNPWRFSSKRVDGSGLVFFGRRYYDPQIGRWLTQDPLGLKAGPNLYAYVRNRPLTHFDLYGLIEQTQSSEPRGIIDRGLSYLREGLTYIKDIVFSAIDTILEHAIPCSLLGFKDSLRNIFSKFSGRGAVAPERHLKPTVNPDALRKYITTYDLGIITNEESAKELMKWIYEGYFKAGVSPEDVTIYLVHNATNGALADFIKAGLGKLGFQIRASTNLAEVWKDIHHKITTENPGKVPVVLHFCHSHGGILTKTALNISLNEVRSMLHVLTFGTAEVILKQDTGVRYAMNYVHYTDGVTQLFSPIGLIRGCFSGEVEFVGSPISIPIMSHFMKSPHYLDALERGINDFVTRYPL